MSDDGFIELREVHELDQWLSNSADQPVILFKHSSSCMISARARRQMAKLERPVGIVIVQKARPLSNEIETRFELQHETPQVLIVRDGKLAWSTSHFRITTDAVNLAIAEAST